MPDRDAERDDRGPQYRTQQHAIDDPARLALRREFGLEELDERSLAACAHHAGVFVEATHGRILPKTARFGAADSAASFARPQNVTWRSQTRRASAIVSSPPSRRPPTRARAADRAIE